MSGLLRTAGSGARALAARVTGGRFPIAISWRLTNRCNRRCLYCDIWEKTDGELTHEEAMRLIDEMAEAGVLRLSLSGGEPMLREDFGEIVDRIKNRGLSVSVNTNGTFLPRWIDRLNKAVRVTLSFDGPASVHNAVRGEKGYEEVTEAMGLLKRRGITATLTTVLTSHNLDALDAIFEYAAQWEAPVLFQPGTLETLGQARENPTAPVPEAYRRAIDRLIEEKRGARRKVVVNSLKGLYHLRRWPEPTRIPCYVGRLFARVEADGNVFPCGWKRVVGDDRPMNVRETGFKGAFGATALTSCEACWCLTTVELNYALDGDPSTVMNLLGF